MSDLDNQELTSKELDRCVSQFMNGRYGQNQAVVDLVSDLSNQLTTTQQALDSAVDALKECSKDLEAELNARYCIDDGNIHPAMQTRYERDMSAVYQAKAALAAIKE